MNYGMYLSALGVMANSYRQDVLANNLANAETVGFKRDLALFQERRTALQERGSGWSDPMLENLGGGILATPTLVDTHQGDLEPTGNPLDVAIKGEGFFAVGNAKGRHLTRDGRFAMNSKGELVQVNEPDNHILDDKGKPITLDPTQGTSISGTGEISQNGGVAGNLGLYDVPDPERFTKQGGTLLEYPDQGKLRRATGTLHAGFQERSNVDPTTELAELMDTQRQLEANANMIKYQDSMLEQLVSSVGKIS